MNIFSPTTERGKFAFMFTIAFLLWMLFFAIDAFFIVTNTEFSGAYVRDTEGCSNAVVIESIDEIVVGTPCIEYLDISYIPITIALLDSLKTRGIWIGFIVLALSFIAGYGYLETYSSKNSAEK